MRNESFFEMTSESFICDNDVKRLARKAGVPRMSATTAPAMVITGEAEMRRLLNHLGALLEVSGKKTVTEKMVKQAAKGLGLNVWS